MKILLKHITQEIMEEYDIKPIVSNAYIHAVMRKGMHGLKEAGIIAFNRLVEN